MIYRVICVHIDLCMLCENDKKMIKIVNFHRRVSCQRQASDTNPVVQCLGENSIRFFALSVQYPKLARFRPHMPNLSNRQTIRSLKVVG